MHCVFFKWYNKKRDFAICYIGVIRHYTSCLEEHSLSPDFYRMNPQHIDQRKIIDLCVTHLSKYMYFQQRWHIRTQ